MKKIVNPYLSNERFHCFGCDPNNPFGLHMEFYEDGEDVVSKWRPSMYYQGWIDTMHGGVLSMLIDETCGWVVARKRQTSAFTTHLNLKFRKAVSVKEPELTIRAHVEKQQRNMLFIHAEIRNSAEELCVEAESVFYLFSEEKAEEMGFIRCEVEE